MTLETWMNSRKVVLLTERREALFQQVRKSQDFHRTRAALFDTLTRIEQYKRAEVVSEAPSLAALNIPLIA